MTKKGNFPELLNDIKISSSDILQLSYSGKVACLLMEPHIVFFIEGAKASQSRLAMGPKSYWLSKVCRKWFSFISTWTVRLTGSSAL
jgi:hypothetical protein